MSNEEKVLKHDAEYSLEAVPENARERRGMWSMFMVMVSFTFFSASMSVGARMANGLDLSGFMLAVVIGGFILCVYTGLQDLHVLMDLLLKKKQ